MWTEAVLVSPTTHNLRTLHPRVSIHSSSYSSCVDRFGYVPGDVRQLRFAPVLGRHKMAGNPFV